MAKEVYKIIGKAYWTKVLGAPVPCYDASLKHWTIDVAVDEEVIAFLDGLGLGAKVKNKNDARGKFVTFERMEIKKKTGQPNQPIKVVDAFGKPWNKSTMIGNGSVVEITFGKFTVAAFKKYPEHERDAILEIKVLEVVDYVSAAAQQANVPGAKSWKGDVV